MVTNGPCHETYTYLNIVLLEKPTQHYPTAPLTGRPITRSSQSRDHVHNHSQDLGPPSAFRLWAHHTPWTTCLTKAHNSGPSRSPLLGTQRLPRARTRGQPPLWAPLQDATAYLHFPNAGPPSGTGYPTGDLHTQDSTRMTPSTPPSITCHDQYILCDAATWHCACQSGPRQQKDTFDAAEDIGTIPPLPGGHYRTLRIPPCPSYCYLNCAPYPTVTSVPKQMTALPLRYFPIIVPIHLTLIHCPSHDGPLRSHF